jgi:hypothetical protein
MPLQKKPGTASRVCTWTYQKCMNGDLPLTFTYFSVYGKGGALSYEWGPLLVADFKSMLNCENCISLE